MGKPKPQCDRSCAGVGFVDDGFRLLSGELKSYEKVADSGTVRSRTFCPECGTNVYACTAGESTSFFGLRVGTIRQRRALTPRTRVWARSALPWSTDLTDMEAFDRGDSSAICKNA